MISLPSGYTNEFDTVDTIFRTEIPYRKSNRLDITVRGIDDGTNLIEKKDELRKLIEDVLENETAVTSEKSVGIE